MTVRHLSLIAIFLLTSLSANSSFAARVSHNPDKYFSFNFQAVQWSDLPDKVTEAKTRVKESGFNSIYALSKSETFNWSFGTSYAYRRYTYDQVNSRNRDLHELLFPLDLVGKYGKALSHDWSIDLAPGIATSSNTLRNPIERLEKEDFRLTGGFLTHIHINDQWQLLVGARHDAAFGNPEFYPQMGARLNLGDRFTLLFGYPDSHLWLRLSERLAFMTSIVPAGNRWHVHTDGFIDEFNFEVEGWRFETGMDWKLSRSISIRMVTGYEFDRHLCFNDENGAQISTKVANGFSYRTNLVMKLN